MLAENDVMVWSAEFIEDGSGERGVITGHHRLTNAVETDIEVGMQEYVDRIENAFTAPITTINPDSVSLICAMAQRISPEGTRVYTKFSTFVGGANAPAVGANLAVLVSKYSADMSASGRGRFFWPFPAQEIQSSGVLNDDVKTDIHDETGTLYLNTLIANAKNEFEPGIWSRKLEQFFPTTALVVRPVLATQRPRAVRHQPFNPGA